MSPNKQDKSQTETTGLMQGMLTARTDNAVYSTNIVYSGNTSQSLQELAARLFAAHMEIHEQLVRLNGQLNQLDAMPLFPYALGEEVDRVRPTLREALTDVLKVAEGAISNLDHINKHLTEII